MTACNMAGHCSCPRTFSESLSLLREDGAKISVPPVTPLLEPVFRQFLERVSERPEKELALNDWGTLYRCAALKRKGRLAASLTAGVLLSGQDTDPLLQSFLQTAPGRTVLTEEGAVQLVWAPPPDTLTVHWRTPSVFGLIPMLQEMGVSRIELCNQPLQLPETGPGLPVTLYREAIVSVFPCMGNCAACGSGTAAIRERGGAEVFSHRNLILAEMPLRQPPWADRVWSICEA